MSAPRNVLDLDVWMRDNTLRQKVTLLEMHYGRGSFISTRFIERSDTEIQRALGLYQTAFDKHLRRKYWQAKISCVYDRYAHFVFKPNISCDGLTGEEAARLSQLLVYDIVDADTFLQHNPKLWYYEV